MFVPDMLIIQSNHVTDNKQHNNSDMDQMYTVKSSTT